MKTSFLAIAAIVCCSCNFGREIQVQPVDVELVKIDTVRRSSNLEELVLTWKTEDNIQYISFEPMQSSYNVGSRMKVLMRR